MADEKAFELPGAEDEPVAMRQGYALLEWMGDAIKSMNARADRMTAAGNTDEMESNVIVQTLVYFIEHHAEEVIQQTHGALVQTVLHFAELAFLAGRSAEKVGINFEPIELQECGPDCECKTRPRGSIEVHMIDADDSAAMDDLLNLLGIQGTDFAAFVQSGQMPTEAPASDDEAPKGDDKE